MTDPHELINMPGYGNAEKELRKAGLWRLTLQETAQKTIDDMQYSLDNAYSSVSDAMLSFDDLTNKLETTTWN